jgi:glycosyltransferase involved in cell wall biosynthesis/predicted O-methyltransferase YrrM
MIKSLAVIVPAYNCAHCVADTLQSIAASVQYFRDKHPQAHQVLVEIVVVNDASTDDTPAIAKGMAQDNPDIILIDHATNQGAAAARNTGVRLSKGEILFFCDGDDQFLPEHIYVGYRALNQEVPVQQVASTKTHQPIAIVKTKVLVKDALHPSWLDAIENSIPLNICLRRECHEFIEGYPEAAVYRQIGGREDLTYIKCLGRFFNTLKAGITTVEYIRYPGNNLDRQLEKFQKPPSELQLNWSPAETQWHAIADQLDREKLNYLTKKLYHLNQKYLPSALIDWERLLKEALHQKEFVHAVFCHQQGEAIDLPFSTVDRNDLAKAYNNVGVGCENRGELDQAVQYLERSLSLHPDLPAPEQAKLHLNLGMVLLHQGQRERGMTNLEQSLSLDPTLQAAKLELTKAQYQQQVIEQGYQFTQDWFSHNIPVWETTLRSLAGKPLNALEIGSWEGRSTCWLLTHILTHDAARITCVDTFAGSIEHASYESDYLQSLEERFDFNIAKTNAAHKVIKKVGSSQEILRSLPQNSYDLLYIDGSHLASDVLEDTLLSWRLVKVGGVIIFDDYGFSFADQPKHNPKLAIDAFLQIFAEHIDLIHQGYQVIIQKMR